MDIFVQMKSADFFLKLLRGEYNKLNESVIGSQKPVINYAGRISRPLPRCAPERVGVSSKMLFEFFDRAEKDKKIFIHSALIARKGKVIAEGHFSPYRGDYQHAMYSLSKTVTALAVGIAAEEGLLSVEDKLISIFFDKLPIQPLRGAKLSQLTIKHLLTMTAGVNFDEAGSVHEKDWVKCYLESDYSFTPGSDFYYNSLNTYMLAAAVVKTSGMPLVEYLRSRLFEPLGIENVYWETCPLGIEKGGWGLYLCPEDMLKLGQLFLDGGRITDEKGNVRQIVPEWFIKDATTNHIKKENEICRYGYGYQIWLWGKKGAYMFNGAFGQYVIVIPRFEMVIAITGGNENLFFDSDVLRLLSEYFGDDCSLNEGSLLPSSDHLKLKKKLANLKLYKLPTHSGRLVPDKKAEAAKKAFNGCAYSMDKNNYGLLPYIQQAVHSNYGGGISKIRFNFDRHECRIEFSEQDKSFFVTAGMDGRPRYDAHEFGGEQYYLGAEAVFVTDEDDEPVLKIYLSFIETPNIRVIKCFFKDGQILLKFTEIPSVPGSMDMLAALFANREKMFERLVKDRKFRARMKEEVAKRTEPAITGERIN